MDTPSTLLRKIEDSEKNVTKSKGQQQQDRCALMDMTNDSPIVGLANGGNLETPLTKQRGSRVKNTPGSGEALLRGQVKTLMQMVEEEALDPQSQNLSGISSNGLSSISQVVDMDEESCEYEKCEITKSLDFSEKSQVSAECSIDDDDASIWSMQVNAGNNDEYDDVEEEIAEEHDVEEEEYEGDLFLDELCEGLNKIKVNEKVVPKFVGKHTRFVYNSDDEIVSVNVDELSNVLHLKGLPAPKGKHLRFSEEEWEDVDGKSVV